MRVTAPSPLSIPHPVNGHIIKTYLAFLCVVQFQEFTASPIYLVLLLQLAVKIAIGVQIQNSSIKLVFALPSYDLIAVL